MHPNVSLCITWANEKGSRNLETWGGYMFTSRYPMVLLSCKSILVRNENIKLILKVDLLLCPSLFVLGDPFPFKSSPCSTGSLATDSTYAGETDYYNKMESATLFPPLNWTHENLNLDLLIWWRNFKLCGETISLFLIPRLNFIWFAWTLDS